MDKLAGRKPLKRRSRKPRRPRRPIGVIIAYQKALKGMFKYLNDQIRAKVTPALEGILAEAKRSSSVFDAYTDMADEVMKFIKALHGGQFPDAEVERVVRGYAEKASDFQRSDLTKILAASLGVDVYFHEPWLRTEMDAFVKKNLKLIKRLEEKHLDKVESIVIDGARRGRTSADISGSLSQEFNISERHAKLIARDQISKLNSDLNKLRQKEVGIEKYTWRGVMDDRERESHIANEGEVFSWDDPPSETGNPGEDIECRCVAEPVIEL